MKKLFFMLPCLLLCFLLVAVPVSAAETEYVFDVVCGMISIPDTAVPEGFYDVVFTDSVGDTYTAKNVEFMMDYYAPGAGNFYFYQFSPSLDYEQNDVYLAIDWDSGDYSLSLCTESFERLCELDGHFTITPYHEPASPSSIFSIFGVIGSWIVTAITPLVGIFWNGSSLTFLGVLAVCALAFAVIFLLVAIIARFLKLRG